MLTTGSQIIKPWTDINQRILATKGELEDAPAKVLLSEMILGNPAFTWELISGMQLEAQQDLILRCWMQKNFSMNIWSRGGAKTELAAVFCGLYSIFQPATQVVIAAPGFRKSREILERLDKFIKAPKARLLRQCVTVPLKRKNDMYEMKIGGSHLCAIPLNPLVRGFRSSVLIVDEMLLVGEELFTSVLFPFLASKTGIQQALQIKNMEDFLIKKGLMKEEHRQGTENIKKIILLSSASYQFDYMFQLYNNWVEQIIDASKRDQTIKGTYFVSRLGWKAIPDTIMDYDMVMKSKESMSDQMFGKEFDARFAKDSGSFFSMAKMEELTVKPGEFPCAEMKGDTNAEYIISIDTNQSEAESSDNFAMSVVKLLPDKKGVILVHAYAKPKYELKKYANYFYYLLKSFNPIFVFYDKTGGGHTFIEACNNMSLFKDNKMELKELSVDFDKGDDYVGALREAKREYSKESRRICYGQIFNTGSIGRMNDNLATSIDRKRLYFASRLSGQEDSFKRAKEIVPDHIFENEKDKEAARLDFIDDIDDTIAMTKNETALVEVTVSPLGARQFNLPQHLKRSDSPNRVRKDSYSALLMACWGAKVWYDMQEHKEKPKSFAPIMI